MAELDYASENRDFEDDINSAGVELGEGDWGANVPVPTRQKGWGLDDALTLVRQLQKEVRPFGYHIALGGGVLNKGMSEKDLDLYFLPLVEHAQNYTKMMYLLVERFGAAIDIGSGGNERDNIYKDKVQFVNGGKRVDVFVVDGGSK